MEAGTGRIEAGPLFSPGCPMSQVVRLRGMNTTSNMDNARAQLRWGRGGGRTVGLASRQATLEFLRSSLGGR